MKQLFLLITFAVSSFFAIAQRPGALIDIRHYDFALELNDANDTIKGNAAIEMSMLKESKTIILDLSSINTAGKGMHVSSVKENDQPLVFSHANDSLTITFNENAKNGDLKKINIIYEGIPADGLIISANKYGHRCFFADNWPNRGRNWLPCVDHLSDKATVDFIITAPDHYQVVGNGIQTEENNIPNHLKQTHYKETVPLPTKEMAIGVADFAVNYAGDVDCIAVYSWVYPEDKDKGFYDYALAKDILPFFIKNIGPYAYRKLANVQSKTRFGGAENAGTIFYYEGSVKGDRKLEPLLTHEIAHQWFGNSATEKDWKHLWLSEGFATYMTHLYLEDKYGIDTLIKGMKTDREQVIAFSKKKNTPVVDTTITRDFMQLLNANSYQKGGWVLHMIRRKLGDELFWKGIRTYYADFAGRNADTKDLETVMEKVSGQDLKQFFQQWLYTPGQPKLNINWKYNTSAKQVTVMIEQTQPGLFEFPLEIEIISGADSIKKSILVKEKTTTFKIASATNPTQFLADPEVNLLFEAMTKEMK